MLNYQIIKPPYTLDFNSMSKEELSSYFSWFLEQMDSRINILAETVNSTSEGINWQPDGSVESLEYLGKWLSEHTTTRLKSKEEATEIKLKDIYTIQIDEWQLTNETFSLAFDCAFYFSKVMLTNLPFLKWTVHLKNKKNVNYGKPSLIGNNDMQLEPLRVLVNCAYGFARKSKSPSELVRVYHVWAEILSNQRGSVQ